jgi:hypothetical protein
VKYPSTNLYNIEVRPTVLNANLTGAKLLLSVENIELMKVTDIISHLSVFWPRGIMIEDGPTDFKE